jgi:hypothetical protein
MSFVMLVRRRGASRPDGAMGVQKGRRSGRPAARVPDQVKAREESTNAVK